MRKLVSQACKRSFALTRKQSSCKERVLNSRHLHKFCLWMIDKEVIKPTGHPSRVAGVKG